jgi:hypothetical protein
LICQSKIYKPIQAHTSPYKPDTSLDRPGGLSYFKYARKAWADVPFNHLGLESIHSAPVSGNVMEHIGTFGLLVERPVDRVHLASDAPYAIQQLFLLF